MVQYFSLTTKQYQPTYQQQKPSAEQGCLSPLPNQTLVNIGPTTSLQCAPRSLIFFLDVSSPVSLYKVKESFSLLKKSAIFNFEQIYIIKILIFMVYN
jgi:hypothetical protein